MDKDRITLPRLAVPSQSPTSNPPPPPPYQPLEPSPIDQPQPPSHHPHPSSSAQPHHSPHQSHLQTPPIQRHSLPSLTTPPCSSQPQPSSISKPKKSHREVEQKRRMRMAEQIKELKQCVSDPTRGKTDKVSVLQDAVAYVKQAAAKINHLTQALERSQAECAHLRALLSQHQQQQQPSQQQPSQQPQQLQRRQLQRLQPRQPSPSHPPSNPNTPSASQSWPSQSIDPFLSRSSYPVPRQQWELLPPTTPHPITTQLPHHFPSPSHLHQPKSSLDIRPNPEIPQTSSPVYSHIPAPSDYDRPQLPRPPPREDDDLTYRSDPSPDPPR